MPYRYIENIAIADEAFEAWGPTLEEMFIAACDATLNIMVRDVSSVRKRVHRRIKLEEAPVDMLLFQLLQEVIFFKDSERLLLRVCQLRFDKPDDPGWVEADLWGESIDPLRHDLIVDVKAITLHQFDVRRIPEGWKAVVVVDV